MTSQNMTSHDMTVHDRVFPHALTAAIPRCMAMFAVLAGLVASPAEAATVSGSATQTVGASSSTFLVPKFDSSLGTLTGVDLNIYSSLLSGSFTVTRTSGGTTFRTFTDFNSTLVIDSFSGFDGYYSDPYSFSRSPSGNVTINSGTPSRTVVVSPTSQSLLSGTPITLPVIAPYSAFVGPGDFAILASLVYGDTNSGNAIFSLQNLLQADTTLGLTYTYTPAEAVPEIDPAGFGSVVALLAGAFGLVERRRSARRC